MHVLLLIPLFISTRLQGFWLGFFFCLLSHFLEENCKPVCCKMSFLAWKLLPLFSQLVRLPLNAAAVTSAVFKHARKRRPAAVIKSRVTQLSQAV